MQSWTQTYFRGYWEPKQKKRKQDNPNPNKTKFYIINSKDTVTEIIKILNLKSRDFKIL